MTETQTQPTKEEALRKISGDNRYRITGDQIFSERKENYRGIGTISVINYLGEFNKEPIICFDPDNPSQLIQAFDLYRSFRQMGFEDIIITPPQVYINHEDKIRQIGKTLEQVADLMKYQRAKTK